MSRHTVTVLVAGREPAGLDPTGDGIEVTGRARTGDDAVQRVVAEVPDLLVLDTTIDRPDARAVCRRVREWAPATRVLAVAAGDDELAYTTVVAGAAALVDRSRSAATADPTATATAMIGVARGESLLPPRAATRLLHDIDAWARRSADPIHPPPTLTATEREVLTRLGQGMDPAGIADAHAVTTHLVNLHAGYAVAKLQRYVFGVERIAASS